MPMTSGRLQYFHLPGMLLKWTNTGSSHSPSALLDSSPAFLIWLIQPALKQPSAMFGLLLRLWMGRGYEKSR